jgi:hypothetical protein
MHSLFLYIFALHVSGAIYTHPQEHKLQSTAIGVRNGCGLLVRWSRYWLGHPHSFSTVKFGLASQYLLQWTNMQQPLHTPKAVL